MNKMGKNLISILSAIAIFAGATLAVPVTGIKADAAIEITKVSETLADRPEALAELQKVADLCGVGTDDLNAQFDDEGYLTFLGDLCYDGVVKNKQDALQCILGFSNSLGLEDSMYWNYCTVEKSPVSGYTFYRFWQVRAATVEGRTRVCDFLDGDVKLCVDQRGNAVAISANLDHSIDPLVPDEQIVSKAQAEAYIREVIGDDEVYMYSNLTDIMTYEDPQYGMMLDKYKKFTCYVIYTDYVGNYLYEDTSYAPEYTIWIVPVMADETEDEDGQTVYEPTLLTMLSSNELPVSSDYMNSTVVFEDMQDAGIYTYTLDMEWVKEYDSDYAGTDTLEVSVPVMYWEEAGLYVLGDYNREILPMDFYTFLYHNLNNYYVTETPEDLNSWHFLYEEIFEEDDEEESEAEQEETTDETTDETSSENSDETLTEESAEDSAEEESTEEDVKLKAIQLFNDPNYVIGSYSTLVGVYETYSNYLGYKGCNPEFQIPIALLVYACDGTEYPESVDEFSQNTFAESVLKDWSLMMTSPSFVECMDYQIIGHEFAHTLAMNYDMGEIYLDEGYADVLSMMVLRDTYGETLGTDDWFVGGAFGMVIRTFKNPALLNNPLYVDDYLYAKEMNTALQYSYDSNAAHMRNTVMNYLAYSLLNPEDGCTPLTYREVYNLFYESMMYGTTASDMALFAKYTLAASANIGLSSDKMETVYKTLQSNGFLGETASYLENLDEQSKILERLVAVEIVNETDKQMDYALWVDSTEGSMEGLFPGGLSEGTTYVGAYVLSTEQRAILLISYEDKTCNLYCKPISADFESIRYVFMDAGSIKLGESFHINEQEPLYAYWTPEHKYNLCKEEEKVSDFTPDQAGEYILQVNVGTPEKPEIHAYFLEVVE